GPVEHVALADLELVGGLRVDRVEVSGPVAPLEGVDPVHQDLLDRDLPGHGGHLRAGPGGRHGQPDGHHQRHEAPAPPPRPEPAFLFRPIPVNERQLPAATGVLASGVQFPAYPGKGTPVVRHAAGPRTVRSTPTSRASSTSAPEASAWLPP